MAKSGKTRARRPTPLWARVCAIVGCVLMVVSGGALVTTQVLVARYAGAVNEQDLLGNGSGDTNRGADIKGPLNLLLVGIDPRDAKTAPLSDSIIIVHVAANMTDAYVFSIPRDLLVDIPAFEKTGYPGGRGKINSAMSFGSEKPDGTHDAGQGFALLAQTVSNLTGIDKFDAGAIVNFGGFKKIVDAMGGVTMTIDQDIRSEHLAPNGEPRPRYARCADHSCAHPYYGPQKEYKKGTLTLEGYEALDLVRQRYSLKNGDYDRQKNQQQFIKAMAQQALSKNVVTNPATLDAVMSAAGESVIFDGNGNSIVDWAFALKNLRPDNMTLIKLPGGGVMVGGSYRGEALDESADGFFASLKDETTGNFLLENPDFVNDVE